MKVLRSAAGETWVSNLTLQFSGCVKLGSLFFLPFFPIPYIGMITMTVTWCFVWLK